MLSLLVTLVLQLQSASFNVVPERWRQENKLIGRSVDAAALRTLYVWVPKTRQARPAVADEVVDNSAISVVVHIWATWCVPCKGDFPLWRELGPILERQHHRRVRIIHVALQDDESEMASFVKELGDKLPVGRLYLDRTESLARNLRLAVSPAEPLLPMTLWLDNRRIIRKSIVGPVKARRGEVMTATAKVLELAQAQATDGRTGTPQHK